MAQIILKNKSQMKLSLSEIHIRKIIISFDDNLNAFLKAAQKKVYGR